MIKVKLSREKVDHIVMYWAQNDEGVEPVIENDDQLADWLKLALVGTAGLNQDQAEAILIEVSGDGQYFIVGGGGDYLIDAVNMWT